MRLWSIHPQYLDPKGLVALWREGLLAQAVLAGRTRGYTRHPQLERFRAHADPPALIAAYLGEVAAEGWRRGYSFDQSKLPPARAADTLTVSDGQLAFEWKHLKAKLRARSAAWHRRLAGIEEPVPHPLFVVVRGPIESWERP